jgi:hypothetical protein
LRSAQVYHRLQKAMQRSDSWRSRPPAKA